MIKDIIQGFGGTDVSDGLAAIDVIRQILLPNLQNLTPEERKKYFKLGYSGNSFADIMMNMCIQHSIVVPADVDFGKIKMLFEFRKNLMMLQNNKSDVDELIDDLIMVAGVYLIGLLNRVYANASSMAKKSDYPFNAMVKEAAQRYQKTKVTTDSTLSPAAGMSVTVSQVIPGCFFVNNGTTVLKFTINPELSGKTKKYETFSVNPGNSVKVPKGYTSIMVTNMSADTSGSFSVKLNK